MRSMNICLVEDDLLLGRALQGALEQAGHQVVWVRMASNAREWLSNDSIDAGVLDLGLPDGDGIELLRELRARKSSLPVLVITAREALDQRLLGLDAGADDYLVKPFATEELLARLRAVARRSASWLAADPKLSVGDILLDEQRFTVSRGDEPIQLSPTEFALLRELLRHKNRVRTRRQLEAAAIPDSDSQSLDVHISNLRRKTHSKLIRTVRGVGYVVDDPADDESSNLTGASS